MENKALLFTREEVHEKFEEQSWEKELFSEFATTFKDKFTPFPCIYGISGFNFGHLKYGFLDGIHVDILASLLKYYLLNARTLGKITSLVVFFKPDNPLAMQEYHELFWNVLNDLAKIDSHEWPESISREIDHANWEFCFYGEPIFVVCNTPAHVKRKTRKFSNFMLTFQPRWVFDDILGGDQQSIDRAIQPVRERIKKYDMIPPSPDLGLYGNPENREYKQYFLADDNVESFSCPFKKINSK